MKWELYIVILPGLLEILVAQGGKPISNIQQPARSMEMDPWRSMEPGKSEKSHQGTRKFDEI